MNQIQLFNHERFGEVRTILINGKPMFVARDIAIALGYEKPQNAVLTHCKSGDASKYSTAYIPHENGIGGTKVTLIGESNLYRLIMRSELPEAESFQDWVCEEVLPSIREKGFYARNEHERILKVYLLEQATEWEKTFPDDYYIQLCRLWSQEIGSKPQFFGHLTNKYIYSLLPEGVLESLKENTPNGIRLHQTLSPEVGKKHLTQVIGQVTVLMQVSATKIEFENIFEQAFKGKPRQFNLFDKY